ncbi:nuclear receptor-binding protein-like isoform X2 [Dreissena polymorpha]|uniref:nuclear receptor-binding protein-like isoform X2 n=1 Tax=Dreissena polymorpha TaxID=45954 RepID=UPI0022651F53|nr:nuclear receptor-binding protein-like isoform X2 [Dreissena polymorpha]
MATSVPRQCDTTDTMTEPEQEKVKSKSDDDTDEESDVLEESPCGRWQKRREEVEQRDVPGIDSAFLAMDTEEGMEVVWNEVYLSENRNKKAQQDKIRQVFDNLIQLDHPNIVKFHKYWTDQPQDKDPSKAPTSTKPRVIFITEYMSSGSLKQFLKKTKKNNKTFQLKAWKRWSTQILSALSYLHSCSPPVIHGNLTCDTIFIQHNGLIKIGSVAPDAMHHVKTYRDDLKNMHCFAPEYGSGQVTTAVDIYSFGMCALEMAALGIQGNGDGGNKITMEAINKTLQSIDNPLQRDFLEKCLEKDPIKRPTVRDLLFHSVLFEVHPLTLLAAHAIVNNAQLVESIAEDTHILKVDPKKVIAEIKYHGDEESTLWRFHQVQGQELEKFLEDVRNGIYPLTAFDLPQPPQQNQRAVTPEATEQEKVVTPEPQDIETRRVMNISSCQIKSVEDQQSVFHLTLVLRMDDKINRQLDCEFGEEDSALVLAEELVHYGFISEDDRDMLSSYLEGRLHKEAYLVNGVPEDGAEPIAVL